MKFKFNPKLMLHELKLAGNALAGNNLVSICENFLIEVSGGVCLIVGFDGSISISTQIQVEVETEGCITIPGKKFIGICSSLTHHESVSLSVKDTKATISAGRGRFVLATLPESSFPRPSVVDGNELVMEVTDFMRAVSHVEHAMAKNDVRYYLNGMLFCLNDQKLTCVATDGHRLAKYHIDAEYDDEATVIVPNKTVSLLGKVLGSSASVKIRIADNRIQFDVGDVCYISRLVEGQYPDYSKVMPEKKGQMMANRRDLMELLSRVSVLGDGGKYRGVKVSVSENKLIAEVRNDNESGKDEIKVVFSSGDMSIGLNVGYLLEALSTMETDQVKMYLPGESMACLVEPDNDEGVKACVVMPMRL